MITGNLGPFHAWELANISFLDQLMVPPLN